MKKIITLSLLLFLCTFLSKAQVVVSNLATPYTQDFSTLANTGTANTTLPTGWAFLETGSNANLTYAADNGSGTGGNTYSYGATGNAERSFGGLQSGSLVPTIGAQFSNTSGSSITSLAITYTLEQWRIGTLGRKDSLTFQYSTDATSLNTGTWTTVAQLGAVAPNTTSAIGALNGNATANQVTVSYSITGLNISNATTFWIRWNDFNASGADDGLAVDDFTANFTGVTLPPCAEPTAQGTNLVLTPTPTTISGTFDAAAPSAEEYLVVRSTASTLGSDPVDGTTYTVGQALGGGVVVASGSATNFIDNGLSPTTQYYYFIFTSNSSDCTGGPNYFTTAPLSSNSTTLALPACTTPANPPTALNLVAASTSISGSFTAAAGANRYLVVRSLSSTLSATPVDGTVYVSGAAFGGGTVVSYTTSTSFFAGGLTANTQYYFFVFAASGECTGEPFYNTTSLDGNTTTTNTTGPPAGYYTPADGLSCQPLKTALKNIISSGTQVFSYTPGLWNAYAYTDLHRNDANTATIVWDMYSDNPAGAEPYVFNYGAAPAGDQCDASGYSAEGDCYNREHSTPQSFFGELSPMVSDIHHIFPTDGKVNGIRSNFPYGEVTSISYLSQNGSKLGTGTNFGYGGTIFEPIDAYKGDFARACLYMATRYEDEIISQNWASKGTADALFLSTSDETNAPKRRLQIYDPWFLRTMVKWHNLDPVSQKELDRNNAIFYQDVQDGATLKRQGNRNPFVDHPEYVNMIWQCTGVLAISLTDITAQKQDASVLLKWKAANETGFRAFEIERSTDGISFVKTGEVAGSNSSNYNFTDVNLPLVNRVFYRLKMLNSNGTFSYSKVIPVQLDNKFSNALIYPNPTKGKLNIKLDKPLQQASFVQVTDISGRAMFNQSAKIGTQLIDLNLDNLAPGRYFIRIGNSLETINQSFVIIK